MFHGIEEADSGTLVLGYALVDIALLDVAIKRLPWRGTEQESQENRTRTENNTKELGSGPGDFQQQQPFQEISVLFWKLELMRA